MSRLGCSRGTNRDVDQPEKRENDGNDATWETTVVDSAYEMCEFLFDGSLASLPPFSACCVPMSYKVTWAEVAIGLGVTFVLGLRNSSQDWRAYEAASFLVTLMLSLREEGLHHSVDHRWLCGFLCSAYINRAPSGPVHH